MIDVREGAFGQVQRGDLHHWEPNREALAPELASRRHSTFHERQWQPQPGELV
jgi:hypothetical protein